MHSGILVTVILLIIPMSILHSALAILGGELYILAYG